MDFSFVRALCSIERHRVLWEKLLSDKPISLPWCIGGDFNVIVDAHEKRDGQPFSVLEGIEFLAFKEEAEVFDAEFSGSSFTWYNNRRGRARIWKRLDRLLINGKCSDLASPISVVHLARHPSDHAPMKISFSSRLDNRPRLFRFLNVWTSQPSLLEVIRATWDTAVQGSLLRVLYLKLLATWRAIQQWNKHYFGNIGTAVKEAEVVLERAKGGVTNDDSDEDPEELHKAQAELNRALAIEEQFWRQKARVKWLSSGDRNTRWGELGHLIPPMVTREESTLLAEVPDMEEVQRLVFDMDGESAIGPDGFTSKFFTFTWDIIAQDVHRVVVSFFCGSELPRFITFTSIVLLPKVSNPQDFSKFRPISLCNFFNKLLSRISVGRLASVVPRIITPEQTGFVKGRSIIDNYFLAQELIADIGKKARGGT
ncbi:uncharacterized protein [Coffea arabica]|uniref:Endonuclease/exonuclease/phosphatase domain-containing protein n=1 Tax=Coffea arabica TaxID=13443 RepID=A0ABM4UEP5_COFAR